MNINKYLLTLLGISLFSLILSSHPLAEAQDQTEETMTQCIKRYTEGLGISADNAFQECKREALKRCVQKLQQEKKVVKAIRKEGKSRFLLDLGDNQSDWWEGQIWSSKGCNANTTGQYYRDSKEEGGLFGGRKHFEWFRQGWCSEPELTLEESYTFEEANARCRLDYTGETL